MKKIYLDTLFFLSVFLLTSLAPATKKHNYSSLEGKMKIVFPGEYTIEKIEGDGYTTTKISSKFDDKTYFANFTIHTEDMSKAENLCDVSLEAFNEALNGTITNQTVWKVGKNEGIKAIIKMSELDATINYRVVIVGQIQYQIVSLGLNPSWNQKESDAFMKSFKLIR